jgi:hypothetical protein
MRFSTGRNAAYAVLTFLTNGLSTLLALALFFQALEWFALDYRTRLWTTAAVACGTLMLPYSTTFNVHGLVAAWLFTGFYYFLRAQRAAGDKQWLLLSGLAFASCAAMDHGTVFLYAAFWALLMFRGERRAALWFLLPASLTLLPTASYYYSIGGSFKPFAARPELFAYAGSAWVGTDNNAREHLTGEGWNSLAFAMRYGFLCLFGPRGFLVYQPLIWLALYGLVRTLYRRLLFWQEALAITAGSAAMMLLLLRQYQLRRLELQRPLVCRVPSLMGLLRSSCHRIDRRAQVAGRAPAGDGGRFPLLRGGRCCRSLAPPESHGLSVAPL